jgi:hypothetical protein
MTARTDRLVESPVFVLGSIRSGSTLLRCLLNSHPLIHAPHELHLLDLAVRVDDRFARLSMQMADLDDRKLEHLLWDRILYRELQRSGKQVIVDKTPTNLLRWPRVAQCWPNARYIFLLRHPLRVMQSAIAARPEATPAESTDLVLLFLQRLDEARHNLPGLSVRYEDLTADPARVTKEVCDYLLVDWDPTMIEYGRHDHGPYLHGIGDFSEQIKAGRVLPGRPAPLTAEVPEMLRQACDALGYP